MSEDVLGIINDGERSITVSLTNITNASLTPAIDFTGANVSPASAVSQDFSTNVAYTVTDYNNNPNTYTVILNRYLR